MSILSFMEIKIKIKREVLTKSKYNIINEKYSKKSQYKYQKYFKLIVRINFFKYMLCVFYFLKKLFEGESVQKIKFFYFLYVETSVWMFFYYY